MAGANRRTRSRKPGTGEAPCPRASTSASVTRKPVLGFGRPSVRGRAGARPLVQRLRQDVDRAAGGAQKGQGLAGPADGLGALCSSGSIGKGRMKARVARTTGRSRKYRSSSHSRIWPPRLTRARCVTREPVAPPNPAALLKRTTYCAASVAPASVAGARCRRRPGRSVFGGDVRRFGSEEGRCRRHGGRGWMRLVRKPPSSGAGSAHPETCRGAGDNVRRDALAPVLRLRGRHAGPERAAPDFFRTGGGAGFPSSAARAACCSTGQRTLRALPCPSERGFGRGDLRFDGEAEYGLDLYTLRIAATRFGRGVPPARCGGAGGLAASACGAGRAGRAVRSRWGADAARLPGLLCPRPNSAGYWPGCRTGPTTWRSCSTPSGIAAERGWYRVSGTAPCGSRPGRSPKTSRRSATRCRRWRGIRGCYNSRRPTSASRPPPAGCCPALAALAEAGGRPLDRAGAREPRRRHSRRRLSGRAVPAQPARRDLCRPGARAAVARGRLARAFFSLHGAIEHRLSRAHVEARSQRYEAMDPGRGRPEEAEALLRPTATESRIPKVETFGGAGRSPGGFGKADHLFRAASYNASVSRPRLARSNRPAAASARAR